MADSPTSPAPPGGDGGLAKSTVLATAISIAVVGLATFLLMKFLGARTNAAELRVEIEAVAERETELRTELDVLEAQLRELKRRTDVLYSGPIAICNESDQPVTVTRLAATYLTADGAFETFNSEPYGLNHWVVQPAERLVLSFTRGDVAWDGEAVYYSLWLRASGNQYPYAGPRPPTEDWCIRWTGD